MGKGKSEGKPQEGMKMKMKKKKKEKKKEKKKLAESGSGSGSQSGDEENEYLQQVLELKESCADWRNLFCRSLDEDRRMLQWQHASMVGEPLLNKYAWAIPSNASIKLLSKFSPLVEMGAGKGYWAHLVQKQGGNVLPFDIAVAKKKEAWTKVHQGTPSSLLSPDIFEKKQMALDRLNLFLCYPDQGNEVGLPSLEAFQELTDSHNHCGQAEGGYIIHVGELLTTGCISGEPQAPWGRTSSPDFQERLFKDYHCVLSMPLDSFPFSRDFLTIWKRTVMYDAKGMEFDDDSVDDVDTESDNDLSHKKKKRKVEIESPDSLKDIASDDDNSGDSSDDEREENDDEWADIPENERLPFFLNTIAAPCMQHLL